MGAHLSYGDIAVDSLLNPSSIEVNIKASKTDPFQTGVKLFIGRTGNVLCPVAAVLAYLAARGNKPGPLFNFADGKPLTKERFVHHTREALSQAGINASNYAGHSFRIGAATVAAAVGIQDSTIKMLGRWKSEAYQLYIRTPLTPRLYSLETLYTSHLHTISSLTSTVFHKGILGVHIVW